LARAEPESGLVDILAWKDHAFPMFETLSKTLLAAGDVERALEASNTLITISPHDHRVWAVRARTLVAADDLPGAIEAWERIVPMGGLPVAGAAFFLGWAHEQLDDVARAREYYALSYAVDPTPIAVSERMERYADPAVHPLRDADQR
jgi:tetratricopeptide (TPR) repeat protein